MLYGITRGNEDLFLSFGYTDGMPVIIGLLLFNELLSPMDSLLSAVQNMLSRRFEYQADAFAKEQGMSKKLGEALVTISVSNLSNMSPDPLYSAWNYSHPTLLERLDALNETPELIESRKDQ
ncbi:Peptidase M48 [Gracilaria domingensis]|nr:Peptidase M48 [Gracilaria domingensis]